jgi:DNA-binding FrmR family transcriptional regulator
MGFYRIEGYTIFMAHASRDKKKLLNRIRRIRGQVEAIERTVEEAGECASLLQQIAGARGALNGLMAEVMEGHLREHVLDPARKPSPAQLEAADELADVLRAYLK